MDLQERPPKRVDLNSKRPKMRAHSKHDQRSENSINPLKKRQRDLTRLLAHTDSLPADIKIGYERELASCRHDLEIAQGRLHRNQMIKKYHMVRFFERQKATRFLRQARRSLLGMSESQDRAELEAEVHKCEVDLNYTMFFPLEQIYTSLYANVKDSTGKGSKESTANRGHPMWKTVEEAMKNGTLQGLREQRMEGHTRPAVVRPKGTKQANKKRSDTSTNKTSNAAEPVRMPAAQDANDQDTYDTPRAPAGHEAARNNIRKTSTPLASAVPQNRRARRREAATAATRVKNDSDDDETGANFFE